MRARTATFFSALALASATLGTGTALADGTCAGQDATPGTVADTVIQQATLCLLNQQRAAVGEVALVEQPQLDASSVAFSQTMVAQQFFAHVGLDGSTMTSRITSTGYLAKYGAWILGENIAWGSGALDTPANIVTAWMNSEEHRDNILDGRFREIGIGVAVGTPVSVPSPGATYTTDFGTRSAPRAAASTGSSTAGLVSTATVPSDAVAAPTSSTKASGGKTAASKTSARKAARARAARRAARARAARERARASRAAARKS